MIRLPIRWRAGSLCKFCLLYTSFSDSALKNVQTKDLGEVGDMIGSLVTELKGFTVDAEESGGIFRFFKKSVDKLQLMKNRYDHAEVNVNRIVDGLESLSLIHI